MAGVSNQVCVVLPSFLEEQTIGSVVLRLRNGVRDVVVVDDASPDRTADVAALAGARVIRHPRNRGKAWALQTGLTAFLETDNKYVAVMDPNGSCDADEIPRLLQALINRGADFVGLASPSQLDPSGAKRKPDDEEGLGFIMMTRSAAERIFPDALDPRYGGGRKLDRAAENVGLSVAYCLTEPLPPQEYAAVLPVAPGWARFAFDLLLLRRPLVTLGFPGALVGILGLFLGVAALRFPGNLALSLGTLLAWTTALAIGVVAIMAHFFVASRPR